MATSKYIKWDYDQTMVAMVGNKAARLGQLRKIGIKVPQGFAITQKAYLDFLTDNGIYSKIKAMLSDLPAELSAIKAKSQGIDALFVKAEMPDEMVKEITDACNRLTSLFKEKIQLAVRSSSIIEDLKQASFAGLYDSFLRLKSQEQVLECIKACWQSTFGFRVLAYLKKLNIGIEDPLEIAMGVLVQKMINQGFAGVMFTINPVNGDASKVLIEYSDRPGELVVSGKTTPDSLLVDKITGRIDKGKGNLLKEKYIYQLTELAKEIEKNSGCYQDIEWMIDRDSQEVVILQARPETVWNERHRKPFHQPGQSVLSFMPELRTGYKDY